MSDHDAHDAPDTPTTSAAHPEPPEPPFSWPELDRARTPDHVGTCVGGAASASTSPARPTDDATTDDAAPTATATTATTATLSLDVVIFGDEVTTETVRAQVTELVGPLDVSWRVVGYPTGWPEVEFRGTPAQLARLRRRYDQPGTGRPRPDLRGRPPVARGERRLPLPAAPTAPDDPTPTEPETLQHELNAGEYWRHKTGGHLYRVLSAARYRDRATGVETSHAVLQVAGPPPYLALTSDAELAAFSLDYERVLAADPAEPTS
jgi:hypothetical protein